MNIPVTEIVKVLKMLQKADSGPYNVTFHLSTEGEVQNLTLVRGDAKPPSPSMEARAHFAEAALRAIARQCVQATKTKDYVKCTDAVARSLDVFNDWVDGKSEPAP